MLEERKIINIIKADLQKRFEDVEIVSINVVPEVDEDGDDVLFVSVVFDAKERKRLDPRKTSAMARSIVPQLMSAGEDAFPVFSFIRKSEWREKSPEAA